MLKGSAIEEPELTPLRAVSQGRRPRLRVSLSGMPQASHLVTFVRPAAGRGDSLAGSLPPDLLEQVRKRVALLAILLAIAFSFDPAFALVRRLTSQPSQPNELLSVLIDLFAVAVSLLVWGAARSRRISTARLHTIGLCYEVAICLTIGLVAHWNYVTEHGHLPDLTWVPAIVIFFPLVLPGPPRRMLIAAIVSAAMAPLSILILNLSGVIAVPGAEAYAPTIVGSSFAVLFAWMGARVVYGLGREVALARELGSYRLEKQLGYGGMGEVWLARHSLLARPAAIKLIRPQLAASPELVRRFEREAQAIAGLRSPHTVNLFDFGIAADGAFYYAMELLDGVDTERLVRRHGPQPAARVIHLWRQICHSLAEADARGLVHRDIKPANIFVCRYGEDDDFVKVLDFGIVKSLGERPDAQGGLTRENSFPGSPQFMAPEQALGESGVDGRTDLYATGCVAYWLLTGQTVFEAGSVMGLLLRHANDPPQPPSGRTENPIPDELERVILECLAKDPADRPRSARILDQRLAELALRSPWKEDDARAWWIANGAGEDP